MKCLSAIRGSFKRAVLFLIFVWYFSWNYFRTRILLFFIFTCFLLLGGGGFAPHTPLPRGNRPLKPLHSLIFLFDTFSWNYFRTRILLFFIFTCFRLLGTSPPPNPLTKGQPPLGTPSMSLQHEKSWLRPCPSQIINLGTRKSGGGGRNA